LKWSQDEKMGGDPHFFINIMSQDTKLASNKTSWFLVLNIFTVWSNLNHSFIITQSMQPTVKKDNTSNTIIKLEK